MSTKWVFRFDEGDAGMRDLLGGKGANLAEMTRLGLPVPPGFTLTTEACNAYLAAGGRLPLGLWDQVAESIQWLGQQMDRSFGDPQSPLLVSVRSGAKFSMPGMMDTILNLGLNDASLGSFAACSGDERFACDAYRRLIQMFGKVVMGIDGALFEDIIEARRAREGASSDAEVSARGWQQVIGEFKALVEREAGRPFPQDPRVQLREAIEAVFRSWNGKRAIDYRNAMGISHELGTGVNVMAMVFGNVGTDSGSGVAFTRDPATGVPGLYGEYLFNAQGEDVVSGARTPVPVVRLAEEAPQAYETLLQIAGKLEERYCDVQDVEFTIEHGKLWMLQTRTGKRTAAAAFRIAVDMVNEGLISRQQAVMRVEPEHLDHLMHPRFAAEACRQAHALASGLNASPGAAVGRAVFDADTAQQWGKEGQPVILVRPETNPDDVHGMLEARGILTQHGGATSHAAVVARGLGLPCVTGCEVIRIDLMQKEFTVNGSTVREGDTISLDGSTGTVFLGEVPTIAPALDEQPEVTTLLGWADEFRELGVWANADYPRDAERARGFGAEGIGLCRTEHMFFEQARLPIVHRMILAESSAQQQAALDELLVFQRADFEGLFRVMDGLPVIIRLIDPPLHEFLPDYDGLLSEVVTLRTNGEDPDKLAKRERMLLKMQSMREANPMLGLRGVRLGIMRPAINQMQVRAIFEAACNVAAEGVNAVPEVMIPLSAHVNEIKLLRALLEEVAQAVMAEKGRTVRYKFGTMIEIPRAALTAGEMAGEAQFFSFGTNDLTQMTFGISRDDAEGKFLLKYVEDGLLPVNPFQTIDEAGVGRLVELCVNEGRAARPDLEVGICGEHGGDPASVAFCHRVGLDYVSCSPFRVPVARLAAAQAAIAAANGNLTLKDV